MTQLLPDAQRCPFAAKLAAQQMKAVRTRRNCSQYHQMPAQIAQAQMIKLGVMSRHEGKDSVADATGQRAGTNTPLCTDKSGGASLTQQVYQLPDSGLVQRGLAIFLRHARMIESDDLLNRRFTDLLSFVDRVRKIWQLASCM